MGVIWKYNVPSATVTRDNSLKIAKTNDNNSNNEKVYGEKENSIT